MVRSSGAVAALLFATLAVPAGARPSKVPPPPPITFDRPSPSPAPTVVLPPTVPDETYGDWVVTALNNGAYMAATANNAKSAFGSVCDRTSCTAFFDTGIDCEIGASYPALVNAPAGSYPVSLTCEQVGKSKLYSVPLAGSIADAMSVGGVLGIAFPMASGEFKVARFSLTGAARASARISQLAQGNRQTDKQQASDNLTL